jgi:DNA-binding NtrC family response regulator
VCWPNRIWKNRDTRSCPRARRRARSRCSIRPPSSIFFSPNLKDEIAAGIELAQQAAKRKPNLKVLYTTERSLTDGMKARFVKNSAFLAKPYTVEQLLTTLSVHFRISPQARRQPVSV